MPSLMIQPQKALQQIVRLHSPHGMLPLTICKSTTQVIVENPVRDFSPTFSKESGDYIPCAKNLISDSSKMLQ